MSETAQNGLNVSVATSSSNDFVSDDFNHLMEKTHQTLRNMYLNSYTIKDMQQFTKTYMPLLKDVSVEQLVKGFNSLVEYAGHSEFPPNPVAFRKLCVGERSIAKGIDVDAAHKRITAEGERHMLRQQDSVKARPEVGATASQQIRDAMADVWGETRTRVK